MASAAAGQKAGGANAEETEEELERLRHAFAKDCEFKIEKLPLFTIQAKGEANFSFIRRCSADHDVWLW